MPLKWRRPHFNGYPRLWNRFQVKGVWYIVQDLPPSMNDRAIEFMNEHYNRDEPLIAALKLHENPFFNDYCTLMFKWVVLEQKTALICYKEGNDDEIIGLNMNYVTTNTDTQDIRDRWRDFYSTCQQYYRAYTDKTRYTWEARREANENLIRYRNVIQWMLNRGKHFDAEKVLIGGGLCVAPEYRKMGIARQILRARVPFCKEFDIPLTLNVFTSDAADRCAITAGFQSDLLYSYNAIQETLNIPTNVDSKFISLRYMDIDLSDDEDGDD